MWSFDYKAEMPWVMYVHTLQWSELKVACASARGADLNTDRLNIIIHYSNYHQIPPSQKHCNKF